MRTQQPWSSTLLLSCLLGCCSTVVTAATYTCMSLADLQAISGSVVTCSTGGTEYVAGTFTTGLGAPNDAGLWCSGASQLAAGFPCSVAGAYNVVYQNTYTNAGSASTNNVWTTVEDDLANVTLNAATTCSSSSKISIRAHKCHARSAAHLCPTFMFMLLRFQTELSSHVSLLTFCLIGTCLANNNNAGIVNSTISCTAGQYVTLHEELSIVCIARVQFTPGEQCGQMYGFDTWICQPQFNRLLPAPSNSPPCDDIPFRSHLTVPAHHPRSGRGLLI